MARNALLHPLMLIGRLDGRLLRSPARDIWLARARIKAATTVAGLAGMPIGAEDIRAWISGRKLPPRHDEGLSDPMSIAALAHFLLLAEETAGDAVAGATLNALRTLLDDRSQAETWGADDLVRFGAAFRAAKAALAKPYPSPTLLAVSERLQAVHASLEIESAGGMTISTIDGRQLSADPRTFGTVWLLACHLPYALFAAGITMQPVPSLVNLPKFVAGISAEDLASDLERRLGETAVDGLTALDAAERLDASLPKELGVTRRSRLPELMRLEAAYPNLRIPAIARLLNISPQGAAKLAQRAKAIRPR